MGIVWLILVIVFFFASFAAGIRNDLPVSLIEFLIPAVCYMLPNLLMIASVYLAILVRFPGGFLDTAPPPMAMWNQIFLLVASAAFLIGAAAIWKRRRVY